MRENAPASADTAVMEIERRMLWHLPDSGRAALLDLLDRCILALGEDNPT